MTIVSTGVEAIQDGDNPTFIEEKLLKLLSKSALNAKSKSKGKQDAQFEDDGRL